MFSNKIQYSIRNAFKAKIRSKYMTEWLYAQRLEEVKEQHENFKLDAAYELMQKLVDVKDENKLDSYLAISDLRLELTARAHGSDLSAEEIRANEFLEAGVEKYASEVIPEEIMQKYKSNTKGLENMLTLLEGTGAKLFAQSFVDNESSEELIEYISNSVEYHPEASDAEKKDVSKVVKKLIVKMLKEDRHLEYLSNEANFERFENAVESAKAAGIIRAGEITLDTLLNGELNPRLPLELLEELV
tara:strand:+ start:11741 stop:12475 length:735 start_codon:yes stop_codon:yes gene_type:complete